MAAMTINAYEAFAKRVQVATVDQAIRIYCETPNVEYCIPIIITHVVAKVVEQEVTFSPRLSRIQAQKKAKTPAKYGCSMVVGMDMAGMAVALMFLGEGHFVNIASRVYNRMQPGCAYIVYPGRL